MDMTVEASMTAFVSPRLERIYQDLHREYPFLDVDALERMVTSAGNAIYAGLKQEAPKIAGRKARFSFFKLPAELRNRIYEMAMPVENEYCIQEADRRCTFVSWRNYGFGTHSRARLVPPPLCEISRQIRQETLPIFYGRNAFVAYVDPDYMIEGGLETRDMRMWPRCIEAKIARLIKKLVIRMPLPQDECTWRGTCTQRELCAEKGRCKAWVPKSAVDVTRTLQLLGGGVPLGSFQAEFGVTIDGFVWNGDQGRRLLCHLACEDDASDELEWTKIATPEPREKVEVTEEDLAIPIWGPEDGYQNRDRDWEQEGEPYGEKFDVEWYD